MIWVLIVIIFVQSLVIVYMVVRHHGQIVWTEDANGKKIFLLELYKEPVELETMKSVRFKIVNKGSQNKH